MSSITLSQASVVVDCALAYARKRGYRPLTVAVLDAGGHLVAFKREDESSILRFEIATGKAWGSLGMGVASRKLGAVAAERPVFMSAIIAASGGRLVPVPGGVLIRNTHGQVLGAVGISGDTSDRDEECAIAGAKAAELNADAG